MKAIKKLLSGFLALALILSAAVVSVPVTAEAAVKAIKSCPSKIRIYSGYEDNWALDEITLASAKYYIKSVTSSSKNLKAELLEENVHYTESNGAVETDENSWRIGMFAKKTGKYTVTIKVADRKTKKVVQTKKVTVFVKNDSPFKKVTVNGKTNYGWEQVYSTKKKINFSVTAASGYKILKIEIGTYKQTKDEDGNIRSDMVYKAVKSKKNASFTLSTTRYKYTYDYSSSYEKSKYVNSSWYEDLCAPTAVRITYRDKWTKLPDTSSYWFYYIK